MVIYLPAKKSKGHIQHCMALKEYYSDYGDVYYFEGVSISLFLKALRDRTIFVQTIDFLNPLLFLVLRLLGVNVIYYLHEPGGIKEKFDKGDSIIYSLLVYAVQMMEVVFANTVMIGRERSKSELKDVYGRFCSKFKFCPLLYLSCSSVNESCREYDIIFVGRLDERRSLKEFIDISGFRKVLLTSGILNHHVDDVRVYDKIPFTEEKKKQLMLNAKCSWNIYSVPYNQSGNTVDALRYGCYPIISNYDPYASKLKPYGCVVDCCDDINDTLLLLINSWNQNVAEELRSLFSTLGGQLAFNQYWLPVFKGIANLQLKKNKADPVF